MSTVIRMTEPTKPPRAGDEGTDRSVRALDARSLRGLAHPLRMRLLAALRLDGAATASQLAERLGESSGATSYHLRQLAAHGFVEDAPEYGKGRERWWRSAHQGTILNRELLDIRDPGVRGALDLFVHEMATVHTEELSTWLGTRHEWSEAWNHSSDLSDFTLSLTPEQNHELAERAHELIQSYRALAAQNTDADDTAQVRVHFHSFPRSAD